MPCNANAVEIRFEFYIKFSCEIKCEIIYSNINVQIQPMAKTKPKAWHTAHVLGVNRMWHITRMKSYRINVN